MTTLILADHTGAQLRKETRHVVSAAAALTSDIHVLVAGHNCAQAAASAGKLTGVTKVLHVDDAAYAHQLAEQLTPLLVSLAPGYDAIFGSGTSVSKNTLPRVAALLGVQQVSDIMAVKGPKTFDRPIYAGNAIATVESGDAKLVATVRTTAFDACPEGGSAPVETAAPVPASIRARFVSQELSVSERPQLTAARVVVSGGRGVGSADNFAMIEKLADALGGAVGASRAAVDAGFVPNDYQVGQTGKVVAPELYMAVGISGAIQHLAGMKDSKVIVAINKDPDAPIFQVADYGLVGDLFAIVPELTDKVKS